MLTVLEIFVVFWKRERRKKKTGKKEAKRYMSEKCHKDGGSRKKGKQNEKLLREVKLWWVNYSRLDKNHKTSDSYLTDFEQQMLKR